MGDIINMKRYTVIPKGQTARILWNGREIETTVMDEFTADDFDKVFSEGRIPNPLEYRLFLDYRNNFRTITILEDVLDQYIEMGIELPIIEKFITSLKERHAEKEKVS